MITADQIQDSQTALSRAASVGYQAFMQASQSHEALVAAYAEQQAKVSGIDLDETVAVVGNTYPHKAALKRLGLRWVSGLQGWIGTRRQIGDRLPSGCRITSYGNAALASMDHADSMI